VISFKSKVLLGVPKCRTKLGIKRCDERDDGNKWGCDERDDFMNLEDT
jgi:hypothetical protein